MDLNNVIEFGNMVGPFTCSSELVQNWLNRPIIKNGLN